MNNKILKMNYTEMQKTLISVVAGLCSNHRDLNFKKMIFRMYFIK